MNIVNGNFSLKCDQCGEKLNFSSDDVDFEATSGSDRQMGPENGYTWEHNFNCGCTNEIEIVYEVWEYPLGAFNNDKVEITGGKEINRFGYDFHGASESDYN